MPIHSTSSSTAETLAARFQVEVQNQINTPLEGGTSRSVSIPIPGGFITGQFNGVAPPPEEFARMISLMTGSLAQLPQAQHAQAQQIPSAGQGVDSGVQRQTPHAPDSRIQPPELQPNTLEAHRLGDPDIEPRVPVSAPPLRGMGPPTVASRGLGTSAGGPAMLDGSTSRIPPLASGVTPASGPSAPPQSSDDLDESDDELPPLQPADVRDMKKKYDLNASAYEAQTCKRSKMHAYS